MLDRDMWLFVLLAAVGGLLGSMVRGLDSKDGIRWLVVLVETLASAFAGIIVMLLCQYENLDIRLTGVIVGVCGWVGGRTAMVWMEKRVRRIIGGS
jgi:hypothetical protein